MHADLFFDSHGIVSLPAESAVILYCLAEQDFFDLLLHAKFTAGLTDKVLEDLVSAYTTLTIHEGFHITILGQTDPGVRVFLVVCCGQKLEIGRGEELVNIRVRDLGQFGGLPLRGSPGLANEKGRDSLHEVGVLHEFARDGMLATESLCDGPARASLKCLQSNSHRCRRSLLDGALCLLDPLLDILGSVLVLQNRLEAFVDVLNCATRSKDVVNSRANVATDRAGDGLVVGKTSREFLDGRVDDMQALLQSCVVLELQLTKASFQIRER